MKREKKEREGGGRGREVLQGCVPEDLKGYFRNLSVP
jgi:hypothetical protein